MISEARISALVVSLLTGVGLTVVLNMALRNLGFVLMLTIPATLVMAAGMVLFASDNIKKGGAKPPKGS